VSDRHPIFAAEQSPAIRHLKEETKVVSWGRYIKEEVSVAARKKKALEGGNGKGKNPQGVEYRGRKFTGQRGEINLQRGQTKWTH
jgi:hypothetical protein